MAALGTTIGTFARAAPKRSIALAGSLASVIDLGEIVLRRRTGNPSSPVTSLALDLEDAFTGVALRRPPLRSDDMAPKSKNYVVPTEL